MNNDDPKETKPSVWPSTDSEIAEAVTQLRQALPAMNEAFAQLKLMLPTLNGSLATVQAIAENHEKLWTRVSWLTRLEGSKADHVLTLSGAVEKDHLSRDRQTEALTLNTQKLTEITDQREFLRAGLEAVRGSVEGLHAAIKVEKTVAKAIRHGIREATDRHRLLSPEELEGGGKVGVVARIISKFLDAPARSQVLLVMLVMLVFFAIGGWAALKLHEGAEAPQGLPMNQSRRALERAAAEKAAVEKSAEKR